MKDNQDGFTIIELLIATAIFTVILLITSTTIIGISQTYVKGSVEGNTQQTARKILSTISQDIEFNNSSSIIIHQSKNYFCIGNDVYLYNLNKRLVSKPTPSTEPNWVLVRYTAPTCPLLSSLPTTPPTGFEELMSSGQRLGQLSIDQSGQSYTITLEVGYGTSSLLNTSSNAPAPYKYTCQSGLDSSFCAVSSLTTTVTPRINIE